MNHLINYVFLLSGILFGCCNDNGSARTLNRKQTDKISDVNNSRYTPEIVLSTGWYLISDSATECKRQLDTTYPPIYPDFFDLQNDTAWYFIQPSPVVTANHISAMEILSYNYQAPALCIRLDSIGRNIYSSVTGKNIGKNMALIIGNDLIDVFRISSHRTDGKIFLSVGFNYSGEGEQIEELNKIKSKLEAEIK